MQIHPGDMSMCVKISRLVSTRSRATRARVGCVLFHVPSRRIISLGYNGTPAGTDNTMEIQGKTRPEVVHAEVNCLQKLSWWERIWMLRHCVLIVTHTPCVNCVKAIVDTPVKTVYYLDSYGHHAASASLLQQAGRTLIRVLET